MTRPRLLVLTTTFPRWADDIEPPFVFDLCRRLDGFEVHVVAPHAPGSASYELLDGVHVHRFRYAPESLESLAYNGGIAANLRRSRWKYLLLQGFLLSFFFVAYRVARRHGIHLIHAHWIIPTGLIGAALRELLPGDNRLLITVHGADVFALQGRFFAMLRRWVAGEADAVSVVGRALQQAAVDERWPDPEIQVAPMGVDLQQRFIPAPAPAPDPPTLIFAGRLVPKKGAAQLVEAMAAIVERIPDCRLLIAGNGPLYGTLRERVASLKLDKAIEFIGPYHLGQLPELLHRAHVAVFPFVAGDDGDIEGLGLTVIEAMGCGLPAIVGDVPAARETVVDGTTGVLVAAENTTALASITVELLLDPDRRARLASAGRAACLQRFDWEVAAGRYAVMLEHIGAS